MEKLIKLLNEYDKINKHHNNWFINEYGHLDRTYGWATVTSSCGKVISKSYGFIKWLVEKDKIKLGAYDVEGYHFNIHTYLDLIMLLSIQDNPVTFMLSILK